jgi:hypothetical protein
MNYEDDIRQPPAHEIGYRKPPKNTQFKRGQSGNPKGRPKGSENLPTLIARIFNTKIGIREGSKVRRVSQVEAIMRSLALRAMKGDAKACLTVLALAKEYGHLDPKKVYSFTLNFDPRPSPFEKRRLSESNQIGTGHDPRDRPEEGDNS